MLCKSILIIDDDEDLRECFAGIFEAEGYYVVQAEHGEKALRLLFNTPDSALPNCILLDLNMPVMDGEAFLLAIKNKFPRLEKVPVIITSARAPEFDDIPYAQITARLEKPVDIPLLLKTVDKICNTTFVSKHLKQLVSLSLLIDDEYRSI